MERMTAAEFVQFLRDHPEICSDLIQKAIRYIETSENPVVQEGVEFMRHQFMDILAHGANSSAERSMFAYHTGIMKSIYYAGLQ
jgi:hypothetical protein